MKRAFMVLLFLFVLVILVGFLLWYNRYRYELKNETSMDNEILNSEILENVDDFNNDYIDEESISGEINFNSTSEDKSGEIFYDSTSGESGKSGE